MSVEVSKVFSLAGQATTVTSNAFPVLGRDVAIVLDVTASTGTSETLDLTAQYSVDGITWTDPTVAQAMTQATGVTMETKRLVPEGSQFRLVATIAGTTPTFDFTAHVVHYS